MKQQNQKMVLEKNTTESFETNIKPEIVTVKQIIPASKVKLDYQWLTEDNNAKATLKVFKISFFFK